MTRAWLEGSSASGAPEYGGPPLRAGLEQESTPSTGQEASTCQEQESAVTRSESTTTTRTPSTTSTATGQEPESSEERMVATRTPKSTTTRTPSTTRTPKSTTTTTTGQERQEQAQESTTSTGKVEAATSTGERAVRAPGPSGAASRRAVLLGRVSRGERSQDPESQLAALRGAAARHGWTVAAEVSLTLSAWDEATAAEVRRRALAPIEAGEADTLMVWSLDRLTRGGVEEAFALLRHLEGHLGASLWSLQEPFLSSAAPREQRELLLSVVAWASRWESQRKSERLRAKVASKRSRSASIGQRGRWGRGSLATWEEVQRVHQLRAQGQSVRAIGRALSLSKSQVARILAALDNDSSGG